MFRGTTARAVLSLLASTLLTLSFFAFTGPFASAHTPRQAEAKARPGIELAGKALQDESVSFCDHDPIGGPTGPLRSRDRQRVADLASEAMDLPLPPRSSTVAPVPAVPAARHRTSRPSTDRTPAALQVFRC